MNIFKKLFQKRAEYQPLEEAEQEENGGKYNGRETLDVTDGGQRRKYVESLEIREKPVKYLAP